MKIKSVRFAMLRKTEDFENDRSECEVELGPKDTVEDAMALAIRTCKSGLSMSSVMEDAKLRDSLTVGQVQRIKERALSRSVDLGMGGVETFVNNNETTIPRNVLVTLCDLVLEAEGEPTTRRKDRW